jgi:hypothetical protein
MIRRSATGPLAALLLLVSTSGVMRAQESGSTDTDAMALLRWINSAQAHHIATTGTFGTLPTLTASRATPWPGAPIALVNDRGSWKNRLVTILVGSSGKQYSAKVASEERCAWTFFTDESGVIIRGRAMGCEQTPR